VFKIDGNNSNQHIWNYGEGAGSNDDNISLRLDSSRNLYFSWGRSGAINEVRIMSNVQTSTWYGVYVGFTGERLSGSNANATNLSDCFDIRILESNTGWTAPAQNLAKTGTWTSTGGRMDRGLSGDMTIGGRGGNRNFHGKVASMVATTLLRNAAMPTTAEIGMMVTDPNKWLTDYKVGNTYRHAANTSTATFFRNSSQSARSCQVWLMGDVSGDGFAQLRNLVYPASQNETPQNMISMVSNDIQNVTIPGLT
jgi:hypothetical protein